MPYPSTDFCRTVWGRAEKRLVLMWTAGGDYLNIAFRLKDARDGVCLRHPT